MTGPTRLAAPVVVGMMFMAGAAGPAQVTVDRVQYSLVVGVGVDRGHQPLGDAKALMQHLDHRGDGVGGAGGVGDDVVPGPVVLVLVDAQGRW